MLRTLARGAAAGAAGTTVLNALTYADMVWRARPASPTPEQTVEEIARRSPGPFDVPGDGDARENRLHALGALTGLATGVGVGAAYAVLRVLGVRPGLLAGSAVASATAFALANGPMTVLGVTEPRRWAATDWLSDVVPHVGYGVATAWTFAATDR